MARLIKSFAKLLSREKGPMASLPDQNGDSAPPSGRESQRTIPTPFLTKTYELVDDLEADELISWSEGGSTFVVWRPAEFARDILPKYFKHNNFSSFVRQLNTYVREPPSLPLSRFFFYFLLSQSYYARLYIYFNFAVWILGIS